jgi:hypothetical protein
MRRRAVSGFGKPRPPPRCAVGVGRNITSAGSLDFPRIGSQSTLSPASFQSLAVGVGSKDEDTLHTERCCNY